MDSSETEAFSYVLPKMGVGEDFVFYGVLFIEVELVVNCSRGFNIVALNSCFFGSAKQQLGAAILELAIVLVLLLPLTAGLFFFGTVFWQVQVASDAVRHAGRMAAHQSNFPTTCQSLRTLAVRETSDYLGGDGYPLINRGVSWTEPPQVAFETVNRDGLTLNSITVSLPRSHNDCSVCIGRIYDAVDIRIDANFILEGDVDITDCR